MSAPAESDATPADLRAALAHERAERARLWQELLHERARYREQWDERARLQRIADTYESSASWRLTLPLRLGGRLARLANRRARRRLGAG